MHNDMGVAGHTTVDGRAFGSQVVEHLIITMGYSMPASNLRPLDLVPHGNTAIFDLSYDQQLNSKGRFYFRKINLYM